MKCPSCGVWNRAHFTKCFRCGADLTDAAAPETGVIEPGFYDDEPVTQAVSYEEPAYEEVQPEPQPEEELEVYSLYDNGDWEDDDEEDDVIYGMTAAAAPAAEPAAEPEEVYEAPVLPDPVQPELIEAEETYAPIYEEDEEDD